MKCNRIVSRNTGLLISVFLWVFTAGSYCRGQSVPVSRQESARELFCQILGRMNHLYASLDFELLPVPEDVHKVRVSRSAEGKGIVLVGDSETTGCRMHSVKEEERELPILFHNSRAFHAAFFRKRGEKGYETPPRAKWRKRKAVSIAEQSVACVLGSFPVHVGRPTAEWTIEPLNGVIPEGRWTVTWPRTNALGMPFGDDKIWVLLAETRGPVIVKIEYDTGFHESETQSGPRPKFTRVMARRALEEAKRMMEWPPLRESYVVPYKLVEKPLSHELKVVQPNFASRRETIHEAATMKPQGGRLAWVLRYTVRREEDKDVDSGLLPLTREIEVWIDAYTGEYLGGDFSG